MNHTVVSAIDGGILVARDGAYFIQTRLIGEIDGEQFRLQRTNAQFAATYQSEESPVFMAGQPDPDGGDVRIG